MAKLSPQDRVTKSHIAIMRSKEFCMFSGVLSVGDVKFVDYLPTAATNGRDVMYNPKFVDEITDDKELNFIVLHEALHKAFQHMMLWKKLWKESPMLANMAADYVVNATIVESDPHNNIAKLPSMALYDKQYDGMTTRQVFDLLKKSCGKGGDGGGQGSQQEDGEYEGGGHDHHDW